MKTYFYPAVHSFHFDNAFTNIIREPLAGIPITETKGRCGGMAYAALDYWHHNLPIPSSETLPVDGTPLADYIYARLIDSILANWFRFYHFMRTPDHPTWLNGIGVARATREEEFPKLKALLDAGVPQVIGLVQSTDVSGFSGDHQVVAYGYDFDDGYTIVYVYDNNWPDREGTLRFLSTYDPGDRPILQNTGERWRGFFLEQYAPLEPWFLRRGALLSDASDPKVFVIFGGAKFWIPSPEEFEANGFSWASILELPDGSLGYVADFPGNATVVRERTQPAVYVVYGGKPFQVPSPDALLTLGFLEGSVSVLPAGSLAKLRNIPQDGTLLKELSSDPVYLVQGGELRHVPTWETFVARGFSWRHVGIVPDGALQGLTIGPSLPVADVPTWAEQEGGLLRTRDQDLISYEISLGAVDADAVEFVLELPSYLSWRKELVLVAEDGQWTIAVQGDAKNDRNGLYRYQLPNGQLLFRKMKEFGRMQQAFELSQLDDLPRGVRVTFTWMRD